MIAVNVLIRSILPNILKLIWKYGINISSRIQRKVELIRYTIIWKLKIIKVNKPLMEL